MRRALSALVLAALAGCASPPPVDPAAVERVSVHESVTSAPPRYEVVRRLWVESRRSAVAVPTYASEEEGKADLRREAARLGGNGILNFGCYPLRGTRLVCNGAVVKFL
jgi:hypothetical protein